MVHGYRTKVGIKFIMGHDSARHNFTSFIVPVLKERRLSYACNDVSGGNRQMKVCFIIYAA